LARPAPISLEAKSRGRRLRPRTRAAELRLFGVACVYMPAEPSLEALLAAWNADDPDSLDSIVVRLYDVLHERVRSALRSERNRHTLETTDLLHELYIKLREVKPQAHTSLDHFMRLAVRAVHNLLVDRARRARSRKRGGDAHLVTLSHADFSIQDSGESSMLDVIRVHQALERIRELDDHMADHIEQRLFFGLTEAELVQVFRSNRTKVQREWRLAKRRLFRELRATLPGGEANGTTGAVG
jgi:RNA polymerase sigma factor (TIGR02999 family)